MNKPVHFDRVTAYTIRLIGIAINHDDILIWPFSIEAWHHFKVLVWTRRVNEKHSVIRVQENTYILVVLRKYSSKVLMLKCNEANVCVIQLNCEVQMYFFFYKLLFILK